MIKTTHLFWVVVHYYIVAVFCQKEIQILRFDDLTRKASTECVSAFGKLGHVISKTNATSETRHSYQKCFGHGLQSELVTDDRFLYRMLECFKFAGETQYSTSEYTFHYCYGYDANQQNSTAYSVCIPSPCAKDNLTLLERWKNIVTSNADKFSITETRCVRSRHERQWYQKLLPVMSFFFILTLLLLTSMATVYHSQRNKKANSVSEELFISFSAKKNLSKLWISSSSSHSSSSSSSSQRSMITCMYGMRALTIVWIIIGHSFAWVEPYIENIDEFKKDVANSFIHQWIPNFLLTVDTFLILGGTVNAYGWFCKLETLDVKPGWLSFSYWLRFYRHRIIRLWPAYFYTLVGVLFLSSTHYHAMWPELDPAVQCPKYWWQNMLFISSFFGNKCMGWTWYIGTEFIFYLLSPVFLLTLQKNRFYGIMLSVLVIILSSLLRGYAMIVYNLPPTQLGWNKPPIFNANFMQHLAEMYIKPQYRIGPYIVGLLLGYQLSKIRDSLPKAYSKWHCIGWFISTILGLASVYGLYPILQNYNWPLYYLAYGSFHRVVFALSLAWVIYACHIGVGGYVNRFLSLRIFYPFAALSYSVYLSHMPILFGSFLQLPFPYQYTSKLWLILRCLGSYVVIHIVGLQCALLSEFPFINIAQIFLEKPQKSCKNAETKELSKCADETVNSGSEKP